MEQFCSLQILCGLNLTLCTQSHAFMFEMVQVTVVRNGTRQEISTFDLLVGDILLFGYGDILPVDGVLMSGSLLR